MNVLIAKLGATGDVVRTTTLLQNFPDHVTWITEGKNAILLQNLDRNIRCLAWEERSEAVDRSYDLVINLEDTIEVGLFIKELRFKQLFGAFVDSEQRLKYTEDSHRWFDLSRSHLCSYRKDENRVANRLWCRRHQVQRDPKTVKPIGKQSSDGFPIRSSARM